MNNRKKEASAVTKKLHDRLRAELSEEYLKNERRDFARIRNSLVYELGGEDITDIDGRVLFRAEDYRKLPDIEYPDTVNPYLWQTVKNYDFAGVAKVAEGYYIALGIDIGEIGFIKTDSGWIIVDCGSVVETALLARRLVELATGENIRDNIKAIIISHTHQDHYGGIGAFISDEDNTTPVISAAEFEQSLVDENLYTGVAMSRRMLYQTGYKLSRGPEGTLGMGLMPAVIPGTDISFHLPNIIIEEDKTLDIDGVSLDFFLTPNTETRSHLGFYSRAHRVLFLGDNSVGTLHNIYTPRGAKVRDSNYWGSVFYKLFLSYGDDVGVIWQGHGIPVFETDTNDNLKTYLLDHAAAYKYTNDQALLLANKGYSRDRIGSEFTVPDQISRQWYIRPHYGEYNFNARGVYTKFLGFYDGNPVHQHPLERTERAAKLVEYIGSEELILQKAEADYEKGQYQWVAEITNELVYLNPENLKARYLCADALEQLAYQSINGIQRNSYLCGAADLRNPENSSQQVSVAVSRFMIPYVSPDLILDYLGINFDGEKAIEEEEAFVFKIMQEEKKQVQYHRVKIYKGCIFHIRIEENDIKKDDLIIDIEKKELFALAVKQYKPDKEKPADEAYRILSLIENYVVDTSRYGNFPLVEPLK